MSTNLVYETVMSLFKSIKQSMLEFYYASIISETIEQIQNKLLHLHYVYYNKFKVSLFVISCIAT